MTGKGFEQRSGDRRRPRPADERAGLEPQGDAVCWLDRVCPHCGGLEDGPPGPVCPRCGAARTDEG